MLIGSHGTFHRLVSSFQKRRYEQIESDFNEDEYRKLKKNEQSYLKQIDELKETADRYEQFKIDNEENVATLSKLYEMGIINEDGNLARKNQEDEQNHMN